MANGSTICSLARQRECQRGKNLEDDIVLPHPVRGVLGGRVSSGPCTLKVVPDAEGRHGAVLPSCAMATQNCMPSGAGNGANVANERVGQVLRRPLGMTAKWKSGHNSWTMKGMADVLYT